MAAAKRNAYHPHNPRWFNRLLRFTYGIYLSKRFRIHCIGKEIFDTLKPPFVIIPNHVAMLDSLMVGSNVPQPIYWIASDGNMRTTFMRFVLKLVGTIRDWSVWQKEAFSVDLVHRGQTSTDKALFADDWVSVFLGHKLNPLRKLATGRLVLEILRTQAQDT